MVNLAAKFLGWTNVCSGRSSYLAASEAVTDEDRELALNAFSGSERR